MDMNKVTNVHTISQKQSFSLFIIYNITLLNIGILKKISLEIYVN